LTWVYTKYCQTSDSGIALVCFVAIMGVGYYTLIVSKVGGWVEKCFHKKFKRILKRMNMDGDDEEEEKGEERLQDLEVKVHNGEEDKNE
jgi:hypothetical protein